MLLFDDQEDLWNALEMLKCLAFVIVEGDLILATKAMEIYHKTAITTML